MIVDSDDLDRGRALAAERALQDRVTFVNHDAATWQEPADRVICIGSVHASGGRVSALETLARLVPPGGRLLFGDVCWDRPPTPVLVERASAAGFRVLHLSTADHREWDLPRGLPRRTRACPSRPRARARRRTLRSCRVTGRTARCRLCCCS